MSAFWDWLNGSFFKPAAPIPAVDQARFGIERRGAVRPPSAAYPLLTDVVGEAPRPAAAGIGAVPKAGVSMGAEFDEALRRLAGGAGPAPQPAVAVPAAPPPPAPPGLGARIANTMPTFSAAGRVASNVIAPLGATGAGFLGRSLPVAGNVAAAGSELFDTLNLSTEPDATKLDVATRGAEGVSRVASMIAGTGIGAAAGATGGPFAPVTVPLGAVIGGAAGYIAPDLLTEKGRARLFGSGAAPVLPVAPGTPAAFDPAQNQRELNRQGTTSATPYDPQSPAGVMSQDAAALALDRTAGYGARAAGGTTQDIDARIRSIKRDPTAFIELQASRGIQTTVGPDGAFNFSPAAGARPQTYDVGDGTVSTSYTDSAQYKGGVARAQSDAAKVAKLKSDAEYSGAVASVKRGGTTSSRAGAIELLKGVLTKQSNEATVGAALTESQRKANTDAQKLILDAQKTISDAAKTKSEGAKIDLSVGLAIANLRKNPGDLEGTARILSGRGATGDKFSVPMGGVPLKPGDPTLVMNNRTGALEMKTPQVTASIQQGTDGKFYVTDAMGKAVREATAAEKARYQAAR